MIRLFAILPILLSAGCCCCIPLGGGGDGGGSVKTVKAPKKKTEGANNNDAPKREIQQVDFTLTAAALIGEYRSNRNKANQKYNGKVIKVSGVVGVKDANPRGNSPPFVLLFDVKNDRRSVGCEFPRHDALFVERLRVDQLVVIVGTYQPDLEFPRLNNCAFVDE